MIKKVVGLKVYFLIASLIFFSSCKPKSNPVVILETEMGRIELEVYVDKAPITANNFLKYVDSCRYDGISTFYRTVRLDNQTNNNIKIEVIQAGFFEDSLIERYQFCTIPHETTVQTSINHEDGTLSMARNEPGTASTEFFICIGAQPELDYGGHRNPDGQGFAAFGRVVSGMEVVKKIHQLPNEEQYLINPIRITKIYQKD